jgi:thioredoxin 1
MSQPKSGVSRIIVLIVVVAIVAVVIAKVSSDRRRASASASPAATQAVRRIAEAVPPNSTRVGRPEAPASPAAEAPVSAAPSSGPGQPASQSPAAGAPSPKPGPPAVQSPAAAPSPKPEQPAAAPAQPAASEEKAKPLPGSDLAASLKSGKVTFVDFGAGWCKACKQMEPVIHKLAADYQGKANIVYVDTDKYPDIARSYRVAAIPAQFVFNAKGEKTVDHLGYWPLEDVTKALAAAGVAE